MHKKVLLPYLKKVITQKDQLQKYSKGKSLSSLRIFKKLIFGFHCEKWGRGVSTNTKKAHRPPNKGEKGEEEGVNWY